MPDATHDLSPAPTDPGAQPEGPTMPACACCGSGEAHAPAPAPRRRAAWVPAAIVVALLVVGLVLGGTVGAILGGLGALALAVVTALAWRGAPTGERMFRLAVLVLVVGVCLIRFVPR